MTAFRAGVSAQFPANQPGQQGREGGVPVKDMEPQVAVEAARQADAESGQDVCIRCCAAWIRRDRVASRDSLG
jgi:hypothetical protein